MKIILKNKTITVKYCNQFITRFLGLMFKKNKVDYCLCFPKCNSIHTFFMYQKIDVIMTDKNNKILYIYHNLKPYKIILPKIGVYYTYEFTEEITNINIGDYLTINN